MMPRARSTAPWALFTALVLAAIAATTPATTPATPPTPLDGGCPGSATSSSGPGGEASLGTEGSGTAPTTGPSGTGGVGATPGDGSPGTGPAAVGTGTSVFGVDCASGSRQLPTSGYGAACQSASDGTNPGASAAGVTGDTITITLRISNSGHARLSNISKDITGETR